MKAGCYYQGQVRRAFFAWRLVMAWLVACAPALARADGCFVMPAFVWNHTKDINEPTQKAILLYADGREDLILQVKYRGPVAAFGWLVPVPGRPDVQLGSMQSFYALSRWTQEHWEGWSAPPNASAGMALKALAADAAPTPPPVAVIETKTVGAYEVAVLSAQEPGSLEQWLTDHGFAYPKAKAAVIDGYIQQQWYFVAIKIDLRQAGGWQRVSTARTAHQPATTSTVARQLASGELNPLQISFPAEKCVFPLKISSVNGTPSEVQVYVLAPEPLVEKRLFEQKFPALERESGERYTNALRSYANEQALLRQFTWDYNAGAMPPATNLPPSQILRRYVPTDQMPRYAMVSDTDLPNHHLPRFGARSWWLTKQTWTFKPEEMADLYFEPATAVFAAELDTDMGYFAAANLAQLGTNARPLLGSALHSPNAAVRARAASVLGRNFQVEPWQNDPDLQRAIPALLQDTSSEVRAAAARFAGLAWEPDFAQRLLPLLHDPDAEVRAGAHFALQHNAAGRERIWAELLKNLQAGDLKIRAEALEALAGSGVPVPKAAILPLLAVADMRAINVALSYLEAMGVATDELRPLSQNPYLPARLAWLRVVDRLQDRSFIPDLIARLRDDSPQVRQRAGQILRNFTGQNFPPTRPDLWEHWWAASRTTFLIVTYTKDIDAAPRDGDRYHDRGCLYADAHAFPAAIADFRSAIQYGNANLDYSHFRLFLLRAHQGETAAAREELTQHLSHRAAKPGADWPLQVGRFLSGQLGEADFLAAARNADPQKDRQQHCEAWFYAGSQKLLAHDPAAARTDFQNCLATGITWFEEYTSAQAELKYLPAGRTPNL